jgi:tRNA A-37 threonylcarbamoyl transferase component Bud32
MKDHCPEKWQTILRHNNLDSFDALWDLQADWFEPPNERRGGWSGVSRCELALPEGGTVGVFLKRQENHITRTVLHPFGMSTFIREIKNILRFKNAGIPGLEPVYFAVRKVDGDLRAILCTEALDGYEPLENLTEAWSKEGWPDRKKRRRLMQSIAAVMSRMHDHKIQHNCFYPKHIFVRTTGDAIEVRIIDLEKAKVKLLRRYATFRDLYTLNRHAQHWSRTDRMRFFLTYLELDKLDADAKALWRSIVARMISKGRK